MWIIVIARLYCPELHAKRTSITWVVYYTDLHEYIRTDHILVFLRSAEHMISLFHTQKFSLSSISSESLYDDGF
jgi:hypothetical protein